MAGWLLKTFSGAEHIYLTDTPSDPSLFPDSPHRTVCGEIDEKHIQFSLSLVARAAASGLLVGPEPGPLNPQRPHRVLLPDKDTPTPARGRWQEIQYGQSARLLRPETNAWAINPCCRVDKLIACTLSPRHCLIQRRPSARVISEQIGIVCRCAAGRTVTLDK